MIIAGGSVHSVHLGEGGLKKVADLTVGSRPKEEIWLKTEEPDVTENANLLKRLLGGGRRCLQVCTPKST